MRLLWMVGVFTLLLFFSVNASVELLDVEIDVDEAGSAYVTEILYLNTSEPRNLSFTIYPASYLRVYDRQGELNYTLFGDELTVTPRDFKEEYSFTIQYISDALTVKEDYSWVLSYQNNLTANNRVMSVTLPSSAIINSTTPKGYLVTMPDKQRIDFYVMEESLNVEIFYSSERKEIIPVTVSIDTKYPLSYLHLILFFIAIILALIVLVKSRSKLQPITNHQEDILKTLNEKQEKIIRTLLSYKGKLSQNKLRLETGLPKATLSRNLKYLQFKGILELTPIGNSNQIYLSEWFKKK